MATCYWVKQSFAHEGKYYSPGNASDVAHEVPKDKLAALEKAGIVETYDDALGQPHLAADAPENVAAAHKATMADFKKLEG